MAEDNASDDSQNQKPVKKKKKKKGFPIKIGWKKASLYGFLAIVALLWYWGTMPIYITGSQLFGVCRTYVELNVQEPSELRFVDIRERGPEVTVEYMTVDSFGQHLAHRGTCMFKRDENKQIVLDYYRLRRGTKDRDYVFEIERQEKIDSFNKSVPFLLNAPINLTIRGPARYLGDLTPAQ